jgi:hypothetical protein
MGLLQAPSNLPVERVGMGEGRAQYCQKVVNSIKTHHKLLIINVMIRLTYV